MMAPSTGGPHGCTYSLFRVGRHHLRAGQHRLLRPLASTDWSNCDACLL